MQFRPAKTVRDKTGYKAAYEHMSDRVDVKKNYRNEDGAVALAPRNFTTMPPKKGEVGKNTSFGGNLAHLPDEYDNAKEIARKELEEHKAKVQERPFSQRVTRITHFNSSKAIYGEDVPLHHKPPMPKKKPAVQHDAAFKPPIRPPRSGHSCSLATFPKYMENPPKQPTRKVKLEGEPDAPPAFKLTYKYKSRPSSSVATNLRNLKVSYPSIFRK